MLAEPKLAILETSGRQRGQERRQLKVEARGTLPSSGATSVLIHDISETGLLIECSADLAVGDTIQVELPPAQPAEAVVVWTSGDLFGCRMDQPLTRGAVSAAILAAPAVQSPWEPEIGDEEFGRSAEGGQLSSRGSLAAIIALAALAWLIVGVPLWALLSS